MQTPNKNSTTNQEPMSNLHIPKFLTQKEAAAILRKPPRWLERKRWEGGGPKFRHIGRSPVYDLADLLTWIEQQPAVHNTTQLE